MRFLFNVICVIGFFVGGASCTKSTEVSDFDLAYTGDQLVIYGAVYPQGASFRLYRTMPPGQPYFSSDFTIRDGASVLLSSVGGAYVQELVFDSSKGEYVLEDPLDTTLSYIVTASYNDYPTVASEELKMPPAAFTTLEFGDEDQNERRNIPFSSETMFSPDTYLLFENIVEDTTNIPRGTSFLSTNFDDLFADQCGIVGEAKYLAFSTHCFLNQSLSLEATHVYSKFRQDDFIAEVGVDPVRVGQRIGTISKKDFDFFVSASNVQLKFGTFCLGNGA